LSSHPLALAPLLAGDPVTLAAATSLEDLLRTLGVAPSSPGALVKPLGFEAALVWCLGVDAPRVELRWLHASAAASNALGAPGAVVLLVLSAPWREVARALRVASRLAACFRDSTLAVRARDARTREQVVEVLAAAEAGAGEEPLESSLLLELLDSRAGGLASVEAARRLAACGPNHLVHLRRRSLALRFAEQFTSLFAVLLWVAGGLAFLAGLAELGWAVFAVILVNGGFSFLQEYRAERAIEALQDLLPHEIAVRRDGARRLVPASTLVPGDVVQLQDGDRVPADAQLLEAAGLRVDQSALTGESHPVLKLPALGNERANVPLAERQELVFAGTGVMAGGGVAIVRATGMNSAIGDIARLTQTVEEPPSPLQREMARVTRIVTLLAAAIGVAFFALSVSTRVVSPTEGFVFALGVIVANVPEGLLPTLTLALALGVQRMARERSVVKRLSAVETLGAITVICTDKTGTLTQNRMTARQLWCGGESFSTEEIGTAPSPAVRALLEAAALASQASATRGDPTEVALVAAAEAAGIATGPLRAAHPLRTPHPFDSFRKRMTLVRERGDGELAAYVKGAPLEMLALCARIRWNGEDEALDETKRRAVIAEHDRLAAEGLRLLAVAVRALPADRGSAPTAQVERDLTLLGVLALWDPPRPDVAEAIQLCRRAGIRVVMVTGDGGLTASAIARQIGLDVSKVVTGSELERTSRESLRALAGEPGVLFARASPAHKLAIVSELRAAGEIVAVTGDGVNDAPALKAADIGVAMGRRGSEVAKEAAEMVITDDRFASIVSAVRQGRAIYANMGKFVRYIFASNVPELVPFLVFVFLGTPLPLTVMQILAVDLGTDLLPALALGAEAPEPDVMERPPRPRSQRLLDRRRLLHAYGFLGVIEAALAMAAFFWTYWLAGWRPGLPMDAGGDLYQRATTMTLSGIVAAQIGNVFACRTDRASVFRVGIFRNRGILLGIAAELGLLLLLIGVPPLADVFGLAPLRPQEWLVLLPFPALVLGLEEARKAWLRRRHAAPGESAQTYKP
jgi:calcium-translocating P-type ATPase